ncbi:MAG: ABC transporter substrate-binding protein [Desulfobacterota bacterium]|nr:ABC transporter substrate-binding protein [Thermodesulfobacteriota bacterium]
MKRSYLFIGAAVLYCLCAHHAIAAEPIKIGALFAVTGPAAYLGEPEKNTVLMVQEQINAAGGINGRPLEIIVEDTEGDEAKAVMKAKKVITQDNVVAIVGPTRSGTTMAVIPIVEKYEIPLISCAAAEDIVKPVKKWVFKTPQSDADAVRVIYEKIRAMGLSKVAITTGTTGFGAAGREQLKKLAPEYGITIVADETYGPKDTDMTAQLTKIKATDAQAIINWEIVPAQTTIIKNRKQLGITIPLFQSHGFGNIKFARDAGDAADGVLFPGGRLLAVETLPDSHPQKALLAKYKKDYEEKYKTDVSTFGGHAYDAIMLVIAALKAVGPDKAKIRDYIENTKNFIGTGGIFNYSPDDHCGLKKDAFEMLMVKGGNFVVAH